MFTFTFYDEEKQETVTKEITETCNRNTAMALCNDYLRTKQWFMNCVNARKYAWVTISGRPDDYLWIELPKGIDGRAWLGYKD